jgi:hypothetical protein
MICPALLLFRTFLSERIPKNFKRVLLLARELKRYERRDHTPVAGGKPGQAGGSDTRQATRFGLLDPGSLPL